MPISKNNPGKKDIDEFVKENKAKFADVVELELQKLKNIKVTFGLKVNFSRETNGETHEMKK